MALGLALSTAIGGLAHRWGALSLSGMAGAVLLGAVFFGFAGWPGAALLIAFFVSSSLLSHFGRRRKRILLGETAKGSRRDLAQTLANGGVAGLLAFGLALVGPQSAVYLALAFAGALATANADTWATELGVLAAQTPRLITTGQRVSPGSSGGVTPAGTLAALAGASFIGFIAALMGEVGAVPGLAWLAWPPPISEIPGSTWVGVVAAAGLAGALFDSLLGASVQAAYYCPICDASTEQAIHRRCGQSAKWVRGWRWLDNDWVNFLATAAGAVMAAMLAMLLT